MSMYKGTRSFDREQLVFMVDVILTAAVDRAESCLPPCVPIDDYYDYGEEMESWIIAGVETAGMSLAILYAQLTDDGMGAGDALDIIHFREAVNALIDERVNDGPQVTPDGKCIPPCRETAEKFVDEVFSEYLSENE